MNLAQWKQNEQMVAWTVKTFSSAQGREFLKMLEDSHPRLSVIPFEAHDTACTRKLGMNDGYQTALNNIAEALKLRTAVTEPEPTFGAEEILKSLENKKK
jgi:hypothetical protein